MKIRKIRLAHIVSLVFAVIILIVVIFLVHRLHTEQGSYPDSNSLNTMKQTITDVSELMVLPSNQIPAFATVSVQSRFEYQTFFTDVAVGDKVLMYTESHEVILYDPVKKQIKGVAPLYIGVQPEEAP